MEITKIEVQKNNKERFNVYIDGAFALGIDSATYVHFNMKKGMILTKEQLAEITHYDQYRKALNSAIYFLSFKKRTAKEVEAYLIKDEISEDIVQKVLKYCFDEGYINHDDYAQSLMNTMMNTTDKGPEIFRQKLLEKGIEKTIIDDYYDKFTAQIDEERMTPLITKLMDKHMKKSSKKLAQQKTLQTLAQKGYNLNIILPFMDAEMYEDDSDVLMKELEKQYTRLARKEEGSSLKMKVTQSLLRKGFSYDDIITAYKESGILDE